MTRDDLTHPGCHATSPAAWSGLWAAPGALETNDSLGY